MVFVGVISMILYDVGRGICFIFDDYDIPPGTLIFCVGAMKAFSLFNAAFNSLANNISSFYHNIYVQKVCAMLVFLQH